MEFCFVIELATNDFRNHEFWLSKWPLPTSSNQQLYSNGSIECYKARLVVLGNKKEYGLDYDETFVPIAKMTIMHIILALAASQSWPLLQMNVKNVFLHRGLMEEDYIKLSHGLEVPNAGCHQGLKESHQKELGPTQKFIVD
ncbi:hypothetical protein CR513_38785, partial [Mucuna pruriens]